MIDMCDFSGEGHTCPKCGYTARHAGVGKICEGSKASEWKPVMLGDAVEKALTSIGITKDLVERVTRTSGKPGGCGCDKRKKWLNEAGAEAQIQARKILTKAHEFYFGRPQE